MQSYYNGRALRVLSFVAVAGIMISALPVSAAERGSPESASPELLRISGRSHRYLAANLVVKYEATRKHLLCRKVTAILPKPQTEPKVQTIDFASDLRDGGRYVLHAHLAEPTRSFCRFKMVEAKLVIRPVLPAFKFQTALSRFESSISIPIDLSGDVGEAHSLHELRKIRVHFMGERQDPSGWHATAAKLMDRDGNVLPGGTHAQLVDPLTVRLEQVRSTEYELDLELSEPFEQALAVQRAVVPPFTLEGQIGSGADLSVVAHYEATRLIPSCTQRLVHEEMAAVRGKLRTLRFKAKKRSGRYTLDVDVSKGLGGACAWSFLYLELVPLPKAPGWDEAPVGVELMVPGSRLATPKSFADVPDLVCGAWDENHQFYCDFYDLGRACRVDWGTAVKNRAVLLDGADPRGLADDGSRGKVRYALNLLDPQRVFRYRQAPDTCE